MPGDVRMRGFAKQTEVEEVEAFLRRRARALPGEPAELLEAVGRVLAEDVRAEVPVPGFARAAIDGYALRGEDTFGASSREPAAFRLAGESLSGRPFEGAVERGAAVRIVAGAPLPEGADAVVGTEACGEEDDELRVHEPVAPQKNVGAVGEDIREGEVALPAGRRLRPQDLALLASLGVSRPVCVRQPRVQLVITGDELLPAGRRPEGFRIVDSNSVMLRPLVARDGGELLPFEILPDREGPVREALSSPDADVFLVSGGSSAGKEDHGPRLVMELGTLHFHGVAMRPSSPAGVGSLGRRFVFLLPGNPVSCLCAYEFFAGPTLRALAGRSSEWPHRRVRVPLARKIASAVGCTDYVRVALEEGRAVPVGTAGAAVLSSTTRADGCVVVPRELEGLPEGAEVEVRLYDDEPPPVPGP